MTDKKRVIFIVTLSLILTIAVFSSWHLLTLSNIIHSKIYDGLLRIEYKFKKAPSFSKDILLVTIDNDTLNNMEYRWPYPRSVFATAIKNIKAARPKVIAFDFAFIGKTNSKEDTLLEDELSDGNKIILATSINEDGMLIFTPFDNLSNKVSLGIITKMREPDGIVRRNLTYMVMAKDPSKGFLSWEMLLLKLTKDIDFNSFKVYAKTIFFQNAAGEEWKVPVIYNTKDFLIHFRSHTIDLPRISFYQIFKGDFQSDIVKNKIVIVGQVSSLFPDLHNTPLGWLPGLTLNANAFLTLYNHDFIRDLPWYLELITAIIGIIIAAFLIIFLKPKIALLFILMELLLFISASFFLLVRNYTWNYSLFPIAVLMFPYLSLNISRFIKD